MRYAFKGLTGSLLVSIHMEGRRSIVVFDPDAEPFTVEKKSVALAVRELCFKVDAPVAIVEIQ